jgi:hypothetical protein
MSARYCLATIWTALGGGAAVRVWSAEALETAVLAQGGCALLLSGAPKAEAGPLGAAEASWPA